MQNILRIRSTVGILACAFYFASLLDLGQFESDQKCFCQLAGLIDDCLCDIETLEKFNNEEIFPILSELVSHDYFKYYKVNLYKGCRFWNGDMGLCTEPTCGVKLCDEIDLPEGLRYMDYEKYIEEYEVCMKPNQLGDVNITISNITIDSFSKWERFDTADLNFCELEDENSIGMEYVDLTINPEKFTGYSGQKAWRIWQAIYGENCFMPDSIWKRHNPVFPIFNRETNFKKPSIPTTSELEGLCLEKRVFYRVVSGLHTSINIHLCANYLFTSQTGQQYWGSNLEEFQRRFDPDYPNGEPEGPNRLRNLYFIYLLELRAIAKAAPYFENDNFILFTGKPKDDLKTKQKLVKLLSVTKQFPMHFDEDVLFQDAASHGLKKQFRETFLNVTRIIDCVTCQKCRLWGKLQTQGLGTALKILFSPKELRFEKFQLERQEIVSLVNAFSRLSNSIKNLDNFKQSLNKKANHKHEKSTTRMNDEL